MKKPKYVLIEPKGENYSDTVHGNWNCFKVGFALLGCYTSNLDCLFVCWVASFIDALFFLFVECTKGLIDEQQMVWKLEKLWTKVLFCSTYRHLDTLISAHLFWMPHSHYCNLPNFKNMHTDGCIKQTKCTNTVPSIGTIVCMSQASTWNSIRIFNIHLLQASFSLMEDDICVSPLPSPKVSR